MAQRSIYRFIDLNPEYEALAALKPLSAYTGVLRTLGDASVLAEEYLETQAVRAIYDCVKQRDPAFKFVEPSSAPQNDMSWLSGLSKLTLDCCSPMRRCLPHKT
ncbi:uncharacterized protein CIMG_00564 [Coccidioides immitis RS]|uniref:Uncharacterized protein n=1 Tax=Coccidioides immitis (strain RS) TaxID=246410 RepID=J3KH97_COCIM|nr:uncharacterized protein CIMG_00564 [Coccidioides immitis RS]EAS35210.3 hypothetical protein CIMG_00564 [Coccidioides immitis RS]TPX26500.1 hypothetical protein DIZ76_011962 [Coccidioides immitis]